MNFTQFHLKIESTISVSAAFAQAIAAARPITQIAMLDVNSDNSTHRARRAWGGGRQRGWEGGSELGRDGERKGAS